MRSIGPELISAASDNDPTNVGTAAAVGAQTGYQLCWLALLVAFGAAAVLAHPDWPRLLAASLVPALSLRPGVVTGGLALLGTTLTSYVYLQAGTRSLQARGHQAHSRC